MEFISRQSTRGQRRNQSTWPGHRLDAIASGDRSPNYSFTRITDSRRSGVGNQGHLFAPPKAFQNLLAPACLIELEVAQQRLRNPEVFQQLPGTPGILSRDDIAFLQSANSTEGYVLEVPDGSSHQVKSAGGQWWQSSFHRPFTCRCRARCCGRI
ncbi:hypothetical protein SDC9_198890 [bioreactor metagenome]|uniref:Uncharacterized protein n=1 Tax=bioreactor metagenome TaxID=1076179 RepID=A0A645IIY3_9ZZZZ